MENSLFTKTYTPTMMRLVKTLSEKLKTEITRDLQSESHHVVLDAKRKIDDLAQCAMLLSEYEACPFCFIPECTSDHK